MPLHVEAVINMHFYGGNMTYETKKDRILEILEKMDEECVVHEAWNIMCERDGRSDEVLRPIDEADSDLFDGMTAHEVHDEFDLSDFSWDDYWFVDKGWGTLKSYYNADDIIDFDELVAYALENDEDFGNSDIREVLDAPDTDEEEVQEDAPAVEDKLRAVSLFDSDIALLLTALSAMKQRCESTDNERVTAYAHPIEVLMQELKEAQNA
jgi:hypothetical protein